MFSFYTLVEVELDDDVNDNIEEPKVFLIDSKLMDHKYNS